jgi:dTMP kinase
LTIILDLPANIGLSRLKGADRLESEPVIFHERVRQEYLNLANTDPERYLVVDATQNVETIHNMIVERVAQLPAILKNKI